MVCNSASIPGFCGLPEDPAFYPFMNYPMYSAIKEEGVSVPQHKIVAIFEDGAEQQLGPEDFGLTLYWFNTTSINAVYNEDLDKIRSYVAAYESAGNRPFTAIRYENHRLKVTKEGVVPGELKTITIPASSYAAE